MGASLASSGVSGFAAGGTVRNVAIGMTANGVSVPTVLEFTHESNNFQSCDTWSAEIALDGTNDQFGPAFWAGNPSIDVQLSASLTGPGSLSYVTGGMVDKVSGSFRRQTVTLHGRDYSAKLLDTLTNDMFVNQTSAQIATTLAQRFGLTPQVTPTSIPAGRFLAGEYGHASQDVSAFRLLSFLAQQEGFDFYMNGRTLVFAPAVATMQPFVVTYHYAGTDGYIESNVPDIEWDWDHTLAGPVTAQVRSHSHTAGKSVISTYTSTKTSSKSLLNPNAAYTRAQLQSGAGANGPFYIQRERPGLTQQQADQLAQKKLTDISGNERALHISNVPAVLGVSARNGVRLVGTGTALDQTYTIGSMTRTFAWSGATMSIQAKGGSPQKVSRL